ncbi:phosphoglycerol transferase MdoB-like AlkP superfamily enzyme [Afipia massiliensis]|uniref:Phosphoglycerol transferase MdoB-like AlkP superfamily enzyme n=1 Tax=Afipia massiliensis TaxID=211460 RepID=A0A840N303_9BRAD|nr:LTA synthase family protein [Afipia massiliensis]MBB5054839.1 phosphoglycerol transferase MdoB-like AlkP superfamily enzyme [Afipia massiliensis]
MSNVTTTIRTGRVQLLMKRPGSKGWLWSLRVALIVAMHLAAVYLLASVEYGPFAMTLALLTWALLNFMSLIVLRRPGISAALSLALVAILITLSQFKYGITQLTLTFLDFLIIDRDTFSFLHSIFPQLKSQSFLLAAIAVPVIWLIWRADPFRIRRAVSAAGAAACVTLITGLSVIYPEQPWEPFQGVNHISNLARSGVVSVSHLTSTGWIEADPPNMIGSARASPLETECAPGAKRPNIVMVLDESSFDISAVPGIKVPKNYRDFFKSADGRQRSFVAESAGGPTWYTEFNVLTGLSARSFGKLKFYVTRIAAGKISRGLPQALQRCGYRTFSLYPTYGDFLSARSFQTSAGIDKFIDMADMGVSEDMQPDRFYFDQALQLIARERKADQPMFVLVYLTANHFPWTTSYRPDLTPAGWTAPGNTAEVDEYIRRQAMTAADYASFVARLKADYPDDPFLLVRFGDHQPAISQKLLEPNLPQTMLANRIMTHDLRYYKTYYAIDALNYKPDMSSALDTLDAAYLPLAVQEAAGIPLDSTFAEQKKIMLRCKGLFYACKEGAEAKRFNRLLIDAGFVKNL